MPDNNQITDLTPLANLNSLLGLYLTNNKIGDLNPLNGLSNIVELYIWDNYLTLAKVNELSTFLPKASIQY